MLFVRLFDLCLFVFVGFLFLLVSGKGLHIRSPAAILDALVSRLQNFLHAPAGFKIFLMLF